MPNKSLKQSYKLQLNETSQNQNDPTLLAVKFSILTFDKNGNESVISKEVAEKFLIPTIANKPIVAKLYESENGDLNLGGHEVIEDENGDITTDTIPVGLFTDAYVGTIRDVETGQGIEAVIANGFLWSSRFPAVVDVVDEWFSEGTNVNSSCELLYSDYEVKDGTTYIYNPIFEGHCILASETNDAHENVAPAYANARALSIGDEEYNTMVAQLINKVKNKEVNELPKDVTETKVVEDVKDTKDETKKAPVEDVVDPAEPKDATVTDTVTDTSDELEAIQNELAETKIALADSKAENAAKAAQLIELAEIKVKYEATQFEKVLAEVTEAYSERFTKVGATELFESEEVQALLSLVAKNDTKAKVELSEKLIDAIPSQGATIKQQNSRQEDYVQSPTKKKSVVDADDLLAEYRN